MKREKNQAAKELGALGGNARALVLSAEERLKIAHKGARASWKGHIPKDPLCPCKICTAKREKENSK